MTAPITIRIVREGRDEDADIFAYQARIARAEASFARDEARRQRFALPPVDGERAPYRRARS